MTIDQEIKEAVDEFFAEGGKGSGRFPVGSGKSPDDHVKWPEGVSSGGDYQKYKTASMEAMDAELYSDMPGYSKTKQMQSRKTAADAHRRAAAEAPNSLPSGVSVPVQTSDYHLRKAQEHEMAIGTNKSQKRFVKGMKKLDRSMSNR